MLLATRLLGAEGFQRWRSSVSLASRATANSGGVGAPAVPMANVATGMPMGICTIVQRVHAPCGWRLATGTPSTGTVVLAAIMPGRWAAPPAPAMMAFSPTCGGFGVGKHVVGACGGPRPRGPRAMPNCSNLHCVLHGVPVAAGTR